MAIGHAHGLAHACCTPGNEYLEPAVLGTQRGPYPQPKEGPCRYSSQIRWVFAGAIRGLCGAMAVFHTRHPSQCRNSYLSALGVDVLVNIAIAHHVATIDQWWASLTRSVSCNKECIRQWHECRAHIDWGMTSVNMHYLASMCMMTCTSAGKEGLCKTRTAGILPWPLQILVFCYHCLC